jgi:hypothetical protein
MSSSKPAKETSMITELRPRCQGLQETVVIKTSFTGEGGLAGIMSL